MARGLLSRGVALEGRKDLLSVHTYLDSRKAVGVMTT